MLKTVVAASPGDDVNVAGLTIFLRLAKSTGWRIVILNAVVSNKSIIETAQNENAWLVIISYNCSSETGECLIGQLVEDAIELRKAGVRFVFAGPPQVAIHATRMRFFFDKVFNGSENPEEILVYLNQRSFDSAHQCAH